MRDEDPRAALRALEAKVRARTRDEFAHHVDDPEERERRRVENEEASERLRLEEQERRRPGISRAVSDGTGPILGSIKNPGSTIWGSIENPGPPLGGLRIPDEG